MPPPGYVHIWCEDKNMDITCPFGLTAPSITNAATGWEVIQRPRMQGMTFWRGREPLQVSFSIMLDGYADNQSQENNIRDLILVTRGGPQFEPGIVGIEGIPGIYQDEWVIETVEFVSDSQIRRASDMERVRQEINLTVREWSPPTFKGIRKNALKKRKGKVIRIKVKKGDTPVKIAHRRKPPVRWTVLKSLNPKVVKKPYQDLKDGIWILVPANKAVKHRGGGHRSGSHRSGGQRGHG